MPLAGAISLKAARESKHFLLLQSPEKARGALSPNYYMKKANLKRLHTVWLPLYDIVEKAKLWRQ